MSAEIVNLRRARKAKAREKAEETAAQNRATFGRSKAERDREAAAKALETRRIDGHRRAGDGDEDAPS
ncbi:DUF4169 family protein [Salinarimonas sp.]|uniref:DUF4169 family protein n=1 Tax=Salinarimonas sp. TaxID=2766526 RepID=UPI0032D8FDD0